MPTSYNNGEVLYAERAVTIGAVEFVAKNISVKRPVRQNRQYGKTDLPLGFRQVDDFTTFNASFIGLTTHTAPARHATFEFDGETFVIGNVEVAHSDMEATTWTVEATAEVA